MRERTTEDLRESLFKTIDDLRNEKISAQRAIAVCKVSAEIVKTAELELRAAAFIAGPEAIPTVALLELTSDYEEAPAQDN